MKIGDEREIEVTFPKEYHAKDLAGKKTVFAIKLHEIKRKDLPELDDEFAKDVSEFETLAALKKDVKKKLLEEAENNAKIAAEDEALKIIVDKCEMEIPEPMVESQIDRQLQQLEYNLMYQGIKLEDYIKYTGTKMEDLRNEYRESALSMVRSHLAIEAIRDAENITVSDEEVENFIKDTAEKAKKTVEDYKKIMGEDGIESVRSRISMEKTLDVIFSNIEFEQEEKKEKAAKTSEK